MSVELRIKFEGAVDGLESHRLSLHAFGRSLTYLLNALRDSAHDVLLSERVMDAVERKRASAFSKCFDLQLASIKSASTAPVFSIGILSNGNIDQRKLFPHSCTDEQLMASVAVKLVNDLETESNGKSCNDNARAFLRRLPKGVRHEYDVVHNGATIKTAIINKTSVKDEKALPRLIKIKAIVSGLGLSADSPYISFKCPKNTIRCGASMEQVEQAWGLREKHVIAALLYGKTTDDSKPKLLWIVDSENPMRTPTTEQVIEHIGDNWGHTMRELAK